MYLLDRENRRLSNLFLPKKLDRYLSKWVANGVYNAVSDNVEDSLYVAPANAAILRALATLNTLTSLNH